MTLQQIRRKYHKQIICPDMIKGDAWNVLIEASALTFHYYWEDDDKEYVNYIYVEVDENMSIRFIEPIRPERMISCGFRSSRYASCRVTSKHYAQLDNRLSKACIPSEVWNAMDTEEKIQKYQAALDHLVSWEKRNPLKNKERSFIPVLQKRIEELKGEGC